MSNQIQEIAARVHGLRDSEGLSVEEMSNRLHITSEQLLLYEGGQTDIPVSFLLKLGNHFGVELTALLTGDAPRLKMYQLTRCGQGVAVDRRKEYTYQALAHNMTQKACQPFVVTVQPVAEGTPCADYSHDGQEFNYVLAGTLRIVLGGHEEVLQPGDSIYFDSRHPHGMQAVGNAPAQFLAVVI